jgi:hypothetical protein
MMESAMGVFMPGLGGGGNGPARTAVLAYEVFPDGHERLIRNAQLEGVNEASFKIASPFGQPDSVQPAVSGYREYGEGNVLQRVLGRPRQSSGRILCCARLAF